MKLSDLTPQAVALLAEDRVLAQIEALPERWTREAAWLGRVSFALSPGFEVRAREGAVTISARQGDSDLGLTAQTLCVYAQTGGGFDVEPEAQAEAAADALLTLVAACEAPDADTSRVPAEWTRDQEDEDPLALVARACLARIALARGDDVQRAWLGALLGVSPQRVRNLISEGTLEAVPVERGGEERALSPIRHSSAQQWLRARDPSRT